MIPSLIQFEGRPSEGHPYDVKTGAPELIKDWLLACLK
jgi:hypothetical protein